MAAVMLRDAHPDHIMGCILIHAVDCRVLSQGVTICSPTMTKRDVATGQAGRRMAVRSVKRVRYHRDGRGSGVDDAITTGRGNWTRARVDCRRDTAGAAPG